MPLLVLVLLAAYFVAWQGYKLRGRISGLGHGAILVMLACFLLRSAVLRLHTEHFPFFDTLDRRAINSIRYSLTVPTLAACYLFRLSLERYTIRSRQAWRAISFSVLVLVALILVIVFYVPPGDAFGYRNSGNHPGPVVYRILLDTYTAGMEIAIGRFLWKYARTEPERPVRLGLRIVVFVLVVTGPLSCVVQSVPLLIPLLGGPRVWLSSQTLHALSSINGILLFLGLSYPLLAGRAAAVRTWWLQRGTYPKLTTIWEVCTTLYPAIVVRSRSGAPTKIWAEKLIRRRNECLDALMQFLGGEAYEQTDAALQAADDLREAIRIYDADPTHTASVVDVVSSSAPHDGASQARRVSRHDPSTTLLLELSEILRTLRSQARQQPTT